MSDENGALVATFKSGPGYDAFWLVVRADSPAELQTRVNFVRNSTLLGDVAALDALVKGAFAASGITAGGVAPSPSNEQTLANTENWAQTSTGVGPDPWAQPQQGQPAAQPQGDTGTVTDRYGNTYQYGLPTAPRCQHDGMALKTGKKKDGGTYKKWVCPIPPRNGFKPEFKTSCEEKWFND